MLKENDIRPEALMKMKEPALEHDKTFLRERRTSFVRVSCPACGKSDSVFWAEKEGFNYEICNFCRTVFMNPRATEKIMEEFYLQSENYAFWNKHIFPASEKIRKEKIFIPRAERIIKICSNNRLEGGSILEIGAGFGTFCEIIKEKGFFKEIKAIEPTPDLAETCRTKGIDVIQEVFEKSNFSNNSFDVVVCFEVIEHLFDPEKLIRKSNDYIKNGGLLIVTCPNVDSLEAILFKEKAKFIDHEHVNYFNPASIRILFEKNGFSVMDVQTPGELDACMLKERLSEENINLSASTFFKTLFSRGGEDIVRDLQEILVKAKLSSHMLIVGRKNG